VHPQGTGTSSKPRPRTRTTTATTARAPSTTTEPLTPRELAARATARRSQDGPPTGLIVGAFLVAMLGIGGVVGARRRNRPVA
jgi:hypothetical protein